MNKLEKNGKTVAVVQSDAVRKDMNDVLRESGPGAVKKLFLDTVLEGLAVNDLGQDERGEKFGMEFKVNTTPVR